MRFFHPGHPLRIPEPSAPRLYPTEPGSIRFNTSEEMSNIVRSESNVFYTAQDLFDAVARKREQDLQTRPHRYNPILGEWTMQLTEEEWEMLKREMELPTRYLPRQSRSGPLKIHIK